MTDDVTLILGMDAAEYANGPHVVRVAPAHGDQRLATYYGPFPDAVEALRQADRLRDYWHREDEAEPGDWSVTVHWLIGPDHDLWPTDL